MFVTSMSEPQSGLESQSEPEPVLVSPSNTPSHTRAPSAARATRHLDFHRPRMAQHAPESTHASMSTSGAIPISFDGRPPDDDQVIQYDQVDEVPYLGTRRLVDSRAKSFPVDSGSDADVNLEKAEELRIKEKVYQIRVYQHHRNGTPAGQRRGVGRLKIGGYRGIKEHRTKRPEKWDRCTVCIRT
jgi:hypothetical protein